MKMPKVRQLLGRIKTSIITLTLVSTLTLTGCTVRYTSSEDPTNKGLLDELMAAVGEDLSKRAAEDLSDSVEGYLKQYREELNKTVSSAELKTEEEIKEIADEVKNLSNEFAENTGTEFQSATLVRVIDGDTIVVDINNNEYKVRLIGINTPESVASEEYLEKKGVENTEEGKDASNFTKELLKDVDTVYLQKDISETDKYGRLLRYVWLKVPDEIDTDSISEYMVNGILVREKQAEPVSYEPDTEYDDEFNEIYEDYDER